MIGFIRGIRTPVSMILMPASAGTVSNSSGNLPPRSRINHRARHPASSRSMTRFLAACVTHAAVGWAVAPRTRIRRVRRSITASTYRRAPSQGDGLQEVASRQGVALGPQERRPCAGCALGCRVDPGVLGDLPHRGGADLHPEDQQLAVHSPVPPGSGSHEPGAAPAFGWNARSAARPGRFGLDRAACRRRTRSRCQRNTVSGRTSNRIPRSASGVRRCSNAARNARPGPVNRTFSPLS